MRPLAAAIAAAAQRHSAGVCPPVRVKVLSASESRGFGTRHAATPLPHTPGSVAMRRKQKRLLQFVGLAIVALLFLPNVGLWSLYRDRVFDNSPDPVDGPGGIPFPQVRIRLGSTRFDGAGSCFLCCGEGIYTECEFGTPQWRQNRLKTLRVRRRLHSHAVDVRDLQNGPLRQPWPGGPVTSSEIKPRR